MQVLRILFLFAITAIVIAKPAIFKSKSSLIWDMTGQTPVSTKLTISATKFKLTLVGKLELKYTVDKPQPGSLVFKKSAKKSTAIQVHWNQLLLSVQSYTEGKTGTKPWALLHDAQGNVVLAVTKIGQKPPQAQQQKGGEAVNQQPEPQGYPPAPSPAPFPAPVTPFPAPVTPAPAPAPAPTPAPPALTTPPAQDKKQHSGFGSRLMSLRDKLHDKMAGPIPLGRYELNQVQHGDKKVVTIVTKEKFALKMCGGGEDRLKIEYERTDPDSIVFKITSSIQSMCASDQTGKMILAALKTVKAYHTEGDNVDFMDASGQKILTMGKEKLIDIIKQRREQKNKEGGDSKPLFGGFGGGRILGKFFGN